MPSCFSAGCLVMPSKVRRSTSAFSRPTSAESRSESSDCAAKGSSGAATMTVGGDAWASFSDASFSSDWSCTQNKRCAMVSACKMDAALHAAVS